MARRFTTALSTPEVDAARALVKVDTDVENTSSRARKVRLTTSVLSPGGVCVASKDTMLNIAAGASAAASQLLEVASPELWSTRTPDLYTVRSSVADEKGRPLDEYLTRTRRGVFHVCVHLYKCAGGINFRCAHESAPLRHMHGSELAQPHIAVNPATAVPARVGLLGIVDTHGNDIPAFMQPRSEVVAERRVAIGARAETMTVDIDRGIHVGSVEVHINTLFKVGGCDVKAFTIPAYASGECTSACAAGVVDAEIALDGPVVRQRERAPLRIVECYQLRPGHFAEMEAPACVEA